MGMWNSGKGKKKPQISTIVEVDSDKEEVHSFVSIDFQVIRERYTLELSFRDI